MEKLQHILQNSEVYIFWKHCSTPQHHPSSPPAPLAHWPSPYPTPTLEATQRNLWPSFYFIKTTGCWSSNFSLWFCQCISTVVSSMCLHIYCDPFHDANQRFLHGQSLLAKFLSWSMEEVWSMSVSNAACIEWQHCNKAPKVMTSPRANLMMILFSLCCSW